MRLDAEVLGGETKSHRAVEGLEGAHLPVEPVFGIRTEPVSPANAGAKIANAEAVHPLDCGIQPRIFVVKPLAESHSCRELVRGRLGSAVFAQQAHIVMTVVRATFRLAVPSSRGPSGGKIKKAVPV